MTPTFTGSFRPAAVGGDVLGVALVYPVQNIGVTPDPRIGAGRRASCSSARGAGRSCSLALPGHRWLSPGTSRLDRARGGFAGPQVPFVPVHLEGPHVGSRGTTGAR